MTKNNSILDQELSLLRKTVEFKQYTLGRCGALPNDAVKRELIMLSKAELLCAEGELELFQIMADSDNPVLVRKLTKVLFQREMVKVQKLIVDIMNDNNETNERKVNIQSEREKYRSYLADRIQSIDQESA